MVDFPTDCRSEVQLGGSLPLMLFIYVHMYVAMYVKRVNLHTYVRDGDVLQMCIFMCIHVCFQYVANVAKKLVVQRNIN